MRLFLVGSTPLLDRVRLAFNEWMPDGETHMYVGSSSSACLEEMLRFRPTVVLEDIVRGDLNTEIYQDPRMFSVNATDGATTALLAGALGAHVYHISDPFVFSGSSPSKDTDKPYPATLYGFSRQLGERTISALHPNVGIIRVGWLYGHDIPESPPMLAQDALDGNRSPVALFEDVLGAPTYIGDAAAMIAFRIMQGVVGTPFTGTFHLAPELITDWYTYLSEDYPVIASSYTKKVTRAWHRNAALVPSDRWVIAPGGLERFRTDMKNKSWDWTASLVADR